MSIRCFDIESNELVWGPPERIFSEKDFRPYQDDMVETMVRIPAGLYGAHPGLGKTGAVLKALTILFARGEISKVLIVAPVHVANLTWPDEIATWTFSRHLRYSVITGTSQERLESLAIDAPIHIINRENLVWLKAQLGVRNWKYDCLVYDEASRLKGGSKRTSGNARKDGTMSRRAISEFGTLAQMRYSFKRVIELSGTPASNGLVDLWGPLFLIDKGSRLGTSKDAFLKRWFTVDKYTRRVTPHAHSFDEIMGRIKEVFFSLSEADYLTLPPLVEVDHFVTLPPKARSLYDRFQRDCVLEEFDLEAVNGGVLTNKLLQMANGSFYLPDGSSQFLHDAKLDVLDSIVQEACGVPVLCAYSFKSDVPRIKKRFPKMRVFGDSASDKRDWDSGRIPLMLLHPGSAGHGLNLQHSGNIMVWFGLNWSLELTQQFIKRVHRSGQKADKVCLHWILARDTVDLSVRRTLNRKDVTQEAIMDAVKMEVKKAKRFLS